MAENVDLNCKVHCDAEKGWILLFYMPYCNDLSHCFQAIRNSISNGHRLGKSSSKTVDGANVVMYETTKYVYQLIGASFFN